LIVSSSLCIWIYLFFLHGRFWLSRPELLPALPAETPDVDVIIPARDEAETIGRVVVSLLAQEYAGKLRIILIDDGSSDGTAEIARAAASAFATSSPTAISDPVAASRVDGSNLQVISGQPKPTGWSGKLWAVSQGVARAEAPVLLLADADIVHHPRHLATLVARLNEPRVDMVSEMVRLNCSSLAERSLVPAFVYFFQMLYPFARVNDPRSKLAAAAGGTVLIRREALDRIGGIASIKGALIDDVTLAKSVKRGGAIYLGHSGLAASIRRYPAVADIWNMITRTAFTQLHYSAAMLALTLVGLTLVWWVPIGAALLSHGWQRWCGLAAFVLGAASFVPTLRRYNRSGLWSLALPLIALFYMAATLSSALNYWRGSGARWKNRDYRKT
jgi:hopene-associated glycosyltransferase HpnB